jgi:hypothetical protein
VEDVPFIDIIDVGKARGDWGETEERRQREQDKPESRLL